MTDFAVRYDRNIDTRGANLTDGWRDDGGGRSDGIIALEYLLAANEILIGDRRRRFRRHQIQSVEFGILRFQKLPV